MVGDTVRAIDLHVGDIIDLPRGLQKSVFGRVISIEPHKWQEAIIVRYIVIRNEDDKIGPVEVSNWLENTKLDIKSPEPNDVDISAAETARLALRELSS